MKRIALNKCLLIAKLFFIVPLVFTSHTAGAKKPESQMYAPSKLTKKLSRLISRSRIPQKNLGVWVYDHETRAVLFAQNGEKKFIPASLTKILTAAATLKSLPKGTKFKTELLSKGKVKGSTLKGDLVLRGGGDPTFVSESMWALVNEFHRRGIRTIEGNIVVDESLFDDVRFDPSRERVRVDRAYDAPVSAMSFNWNTANVFISPAKVVGEKARVYIDPINDYVKLTNLTRTSSGRKKDVRASRVTETKKNKRQIDRIIVDGGLGQARDEAVFYKSISDPGLWSGFQLKHFLERRQIEIKGQVVKGKAPKSAKSLADFESEGLVEAVTAMMKYSNNYVAEMLTKHLSLAANKTPASMQAGIEQIRKFLKGIGWQEDDFILVNPSGLTRENQFRPKDLALLLDVMSRDFSVFPEFVSSMPVAGLDGTLKDRMKRTKALGKVRAKTGMLTGVLGLAGYAPKSNGQLQSFVFLFNGKAKNGPRANQLFDRMATVLVEN